MPLLGEMDTAIDLSDASKALDLANIRFQLMYGNAKIVTEVNADDITVV